MSTLVVKESTFSGKCVKNLRKAYVFRVTFWRVFGGKMGSLCTLLDDFDTKKRPKWAKHFRNFGASYIHISL